MNTRDSLAEYFLGQKLYGDDFNSEEIASWFRDEEEGYADLWAAKHERPAYEYNVLNAVHSYEYLDDRRYPNVLSVGGATGDELLPIISRIDRITILEPSSAYSNRNLEGVPVQYVKPEACGRMPFEDQSFDLVTSFGCLHHVPNVSTVIREMGRCLTPDGVIMLREPIISMGDWRQPRPGLTKRERGIPLGILRAIVAAAGLSVIRETLGGFPLTSRLRVFLKTHPYNSYVAVMFDKLCSRCFAWNYRYHPMNVFEKLTPTFASLVITQSDTGRIMKESRQAITA